MELTAIDQFDPTPYQRVPLINLANMVALAKALAASVPEDAPTRVHKRVAKMLQIVATIEAELTRRKAAQAEVRSYGTAIGFDGGTDSLWVTFRDRLASHEAYLHDGFDALIEHPYTPLGASLREDRAQAERAAELGRRLFGAEGLGFLRGGFREQCEATGAILRMIGEQNLTEPLAELVGRSLIDQLFALQEQYELMIVDQLRTEPAASENLRDLRLSLARAIGRTANSVLDLLDEDRPETLAVVQRALRPMLRLRELLGAGGAVSRGEGVASPEAPLAELTPDQLVDPQNGG